MHTCQNALRVVCVENVLNVRIRTAEIALWFYKSNAIAKAVRELFSVEGIKIDRKTMAKYFKRFKRDLPVTLIVADHQHWKGDTSILSIRSWNKTMS